jgi:hypothetical protein
MPQPQLRLHLRVSPRRLLNCLLSQLRLRRKQHLRLRVHQQPLLLLHQRRRRQRLMPPCLLVRRLRQLPLSLQLLRLRPKQLRQKLLLR